MKSNLKVTYVLILALISPSAIASENAVKVNCKDASNFSTRNFRLVICDLVNDSDNWQDLYIKSFKFSDSRFPRILTAEESYTVASSYQSDELKSDYKNSLLMLAGFVGGVALAGAGARSNNGALVNNGSLITAAAVIGQEYLHQEKEYMKAFEGGGKVEKDQFRNELVKLPPNMGSSRHFLIEVDPKVHYYFKGELCVADSKDVVTCTKQTIGEPKVKPDSPESRMRKRLGY